MTKTLLRILPAPLAAAALAVFLVGAAEEKPPATAPSASSTPIIRLDEIRPGMTGTGRTIFQGTEVTEFPVTVLGVVRNAGPKQDYILAQAGGDVLLESGIQQGMSGSPVFFDGRLAGACAFTFSYAKRPLMGITPIEYMLEIPGRGSAPPGEETRTTLPSRVRLRDFLGPNPSDSSPDARPEPFYVASLRRHLAAALPDGREPIGTPVALGGFSASTLHRLTPLLTSLGFTPSLAGSAPGAPATTAPPVVPGSAIGAGLVRGDVTLDAYGTATWVEGNRVLAFGHPFFNLGNVDFPMSVGFVHGVIPRSSMSFKMASPIRDVGAFRQDRSTGLFGVLGEPPRMIPVRVTLSRITPREDAELWGLGEEGEASAAPQTGNVKKPDGETFTFEVIHDSDLTPVFVLSALSQIFSQVEKDGGETTLRLLDTSRIEVHGYPEVMLGELFSGEGAAFDAASYVGLYLAYLLGNEYEDPRITAIHLDAEYMEAPRTADIRRVYFDRKKVRPGETLKVRVFLQPRRLPEVYADVEIRIPDQVPEGKALLSVGDASSITDLEIPRGEVEFQSLDQLIALLNTLRTTDRFYVMLGRQQESLFIGGEGYPNLPPSIAAILRSDLVRGPLAATAVSALAEEEVETPYVVSGYEKITLEVRNDGN